MKRSGGATVATVIAWGATHQPVEADGTDPVPQKKTKVKITLTKNILVKGRSPVSGGSAGEASDDADAKLEAALKAAENTSTPIYSRPRPDPLTACFKGLSVQVANPGYSEASGIETVTENGQPVSYHWKTITIPAGLWGSWIFLD